MAKQIIDDTVMENVKILAKLEISQEEQEKLKAKMQEMLDYVEKLQELDTEGVEPLFQAIPVENVYRNDVIINAEDRQGMLSNAPKTKEGQYQVPKTV